MILDFRRAVSIAWSLARRINFGLRAYQGEQEIDWPAVNYSPMPGLPAIEIPVMETALGLEPTIEAYIGHLILCLREWWRVLRDDGTCWVNLGDSYAGSGKGFGGKDHGKLGPHANEFLSPPTETGIPPKNMLMIPARFALAAQADGWIIRSALPWIKRNGMPESVTDRPAQVVESIFLLAKSETYFFDGEAVKMPVAEASIGRLSQDIENQVGTVRAYGGAKTNGNLKAVGSLNGRNFRSSDLFFKTWQGLLSNNDSDPLAMVVNPVGFPGAHFATFPPELPETCIRAGTSAHGVCPACGAPWQRVVERESTNLRPNSRNGQFPSEASAGHTNGSGLSTLAHKIATHTTGWRSICSCACDEVIPATVCDPFNGSGTTGRAALSLGRFYIGVDISQEYLENLTPDRLSNIQIGLPL